MANPWIVASVISTAIGVAIQVFKSNSSKKKINYCEYCGLKDGQHLEKCLLKPQKPTDYLEYFARRGNASCTICFCDILMGEYAARLPCLCAYHKMCIDKWFARRPTCPNHPYFGAT